MPKMASTTTFSSYVYIFFCFLFIACNSEHDEMLPKIGIIGAGVSGTSSAYFLRQLFGDNLEVDIFEADKVGGRAALINIDGHNYEAGAAVISARNKYMLQFADEFLKDKPKISHSGGSVGLYGPDGLVFETSQWTAITLGKLVWRYGLDFYNMKSWLDNLFMSQFTRIYQFQEKEMAFTTVDDLLRAMGEEMLNLTKYSMHDVLLDAGFSKYFVEEFGTGAMRTNYGQTTSAHGFVGAVTMCGIETDLWSLHGGNGQIPVQLLDASRANMIHAKVTSVTLVKGEHGAVSYEVNYDKLDSGHQGQTGTREYDIVIVATPIHGSKSKIDFVDFPNSATQFSQDYHKIVTMFVQGNLNKTTFDIEKEENFPSSLLTIDPEVFFNSIGKETPVEPEKLEQPSKESVWKTFFNQVPSESVVEKLFEKRTDFRLVDWLAYPEYKPNMDLPPFVLNERMYYVNAIESAASALEMSAIGAKNVALLAYNHFHGNLDRIDELHIPDDSLENSDKDKRSDL